MFGKMFGWVVEGTWSDWAEQEMPKFAEAATEASRRPNVLVVGRPGAGKSSLVSSLETALSGRQDKEVASAGSLAEDGSRSSFTFTVRRFELFQQCRNLEVGGRSMSIMKNKLPVIYDMPGMQNVDDERVVAILRCILLGRVQSGEPILVAAGLTAEDIYRQYPESDDTSSHRIDRVVYVHAKTEYVPQNLIKAVIAICHELDVTVFSVLSHYDTQRPLCKYNELASALGTLGSPRGFEVQLYHRGLSQHGRYRSEPRTNYFILLLWQMLMNEYYPIHSTQ